MPSRPHRLHLALPLVAAALLAPAASAAAAPPPNDARAAAQDVSTLPAVVRGTTVDATLEVEEPAVCGTTKGSVWYSLETPAAQAIIVALDAEGDMDASIQVYARERSQLSMVNCGTTNRRGEATLEFDAQGRGEYLIRVAPLSNSVSAGFGLRVVAPDQPAQPPGQALPAGGASGQVDRLANPDDAWSVDLTKGRAYRFNFVGPGRDCASAHLFAAGTRDFGGTPIRALACDRQTVYTPPRSGRYTVYIRAPRGSREQLRYRLHVARTGQDDTAPGIELANDDRVGGSLSGSGVDALDLYRFSVARRSDLRITLETARDFTVTLLSDGGRRLACGCGPEGDKRAELKIRPGRYFLAVRARDGDGGRYVLSRLARTITRSRTLAGGQRSARIDAGRAIDLSLRVSPTVAGRATLRVERFDPLAGWLFDSNFRPRVRRGNASVSFLPPTVGRWRVTGAFVGTRTASASAGGTAEFTVTEPPTDD